MCLSTLHTKVRNLGLGAMYEKHWRNGFRELLDNSSPEWAATSVAQKVIDLKAFAAAGVSPAEIIENYRETLVRDGKADALDALPATMRAYREAGYWPPLPDDLDSAVDALGGVSRDGP
ncbi:MAG TPA: hypothetical protein VFB66_32260 [Tepidisphaeraceae bacterium]|nr:hypothetical protein [Tepidisphaeraceae bacterium]